MTKFDDATIEKIFGADDAENENTERFKEYFYRNKAYDSLIADLSARILVGHKGIGKSALLKRAFIEDQENRQPTVWLRPNDIVDIRTAAAAQPDFILRIEEWKKGLLLQIIDLLFSEYYGPSSRAVVEEISSAKPRDLITVLHRVLEEKVEGEPVTIYIDDIDRAWTASQNDIRNISALLNAIRDIGGASSKIRFRIGLRSDVYFLVRTSDESTDKIERNVIWLRWTNDEILRLAAKRIVSYFGMHFSDKDIERLSQKSISEQILSRVITPRYQGRGRWEDKPTYSILMSLTRARPRDLIKLFHLAARNAYASGNDIISTANLARSLEPYSQERLQDIINEFKSELPEIEKLLLEMRPTKRERTTAESFQFTTDKLRVKLNNAMRHANLSFTNSRTVTSGSLIQFLYKIDFITARLETPQGIERRYFNEGRFLAPEFADFGYSWEIHPAYRWALQPQDIHSILDGIAI
ncbi:ATP-binding protein [Chelativorans sp. M5D2P16]|uniref:ATP-binding protein n=1 Tax=Chelativorans sp. M5D2P16 TaxID=3095678 RepID=UPI002ACA449A|nr:ATP-binding protein [Chelativorans sp. M5D2P16]MDZ5698060.1 ATP-binding protein [Chelativorans sp. M5D2P16]